MERIVMEIIKEEMKYHAGIDLRKVDCQNDRDNHEEDNENAICIGGHKLRVGHFR